MNNSINLVSGKNNFDFEKQAKLIKIVRAVAITSIILVGLISVIAFLITVTLPIDSVKKEQQSTLSGISSLHKKLVTFSLVKERLDSIKELTEQRKKFHEQIKQIVELANLDLTVNQISLDGKKFKFDVSGKSLLSINELIDKLKDYTDNSKNISNVTIDSLNYAQETNSYSIQFQGDML